MKLLVSVTDAAEALAALTGGADIVDVKNPREGSLGASFPDIIRGVREVVPSTCELSATIGDVPNLPGTVSLAALGAAVCGVDYVKVGLFGVRTPEEAVLLLRQVVRAVKDYRASVRVIAAGYADAHKIGAIRPLDVPAAAAGAGADGCMLDTARKGEEGLLALLSPDALRAFVAASRDAGLLCALAGSLQPGDLPVVQDMGVDIAGVRSAACRGDRVAGRIDPEKVHRLKALLTSPERASPSSGPAPAAPPGARAASR